MSSLSVSVNSVSLQSSPISVVKFGDDPLIKNLKDIELSRVDRLAHPDALKKTYCELQSGRIVEMLTMKNGDQKWIGSFTYTAEECCREGWATYSKHTDNQWKVLAEGFAKDRQSEDFDAEEGKDWACTWNCLQNLIYLKTGMKVSVMDLLQCFIAKSQQRVDQILISLKNKKDLEPAIPDIMMLMSFFEWTDSTIFRGGNLSMEFLLGKSNSAQCYENTTFENSNYFPAKELIAKIQAHSFSHLGPLKVTIGEGAYLLIADEGGNLTLLDPHNLARSPNYESNRTVKSIPAPYSQTAKSFRLETQLLSGKTEMYPGVTVVEGLEKGLNANLEVSKNPVLVEKLLEQIIHLAKSTELINTEFEKLSS